MIFDIEYGAPKTEDAELTLHWNRTHLELYLSPHPFTATFKAVIE